MSTTRQLILANIKSEIEEITQINTVLLDKLSIPELETQSFPMCFIFSGAENKEYDVLTKETWKWTVFIEVWALDSDLETYLGYIHNKMAEDETRGGNSLRCERVGCSAPWLIVPDDNISGMLLEYEIWYRHTYGTA